MKIFVVNGTTGEYSDRTEWLVAAYTREEDAWKHVEKATEYVQAWRSTHTRYETRCPPGPFDPNLQMDYTGTDYTYFEIELREEFVSVETLQ